MLVNFALIALTAVLSSRFRRASFPDEDTGIDLRLHRGLARCFVHGNGRSAAARGGRSSEDPAVATAAPRSAAARVPDQYRPHVHQPQTRERTQADRGAVIQRLRRQLAQVPGITAYLQPVVSIRIGGRLSRPNTNTRCKTPTWRSSVSGRQSLRTRSRAIAGLQDVASDLKSTRARNWRSRIDRDLASRHSGSARKAIETDAQRRLRPATSTPDLCARSTPTTSLLEVAPQYQEDTSALSRLYVHGTGGQLIPFSDFAPHATDDDKTLAVNHQGQFPAVTISFNLD